MHMNPRTPLSTSFANGSPDENNEEELKNSLLAKSPRRVLLLLAVVGSLFVVGVAGSRALKSDEIMDASGMSGLDSISEIPMEDFDMSVLENEADVASDATSQTCTAAAGFDLPGNDIKYYGNVKSLSLCQHACRANPKCRCCTYVSTTKKCWLKKGRCNNFAKHPTHVISGLCRAPAPGTLVKCGKKPWMYLVMNGKKRLVPNVATYKNIFAVATSKTPQTPSNVCGLIRTGKRITNGARLIRCKGYPHILLHSNRQKRWICDPATFKSYKFNSRAVKTLTVGQCNKICNGPTICNNKMYKKSKFFAQLNTVLGRSCPAKMIAQYSCPPGSHETGVDNFGNCICKLCPPGFKCSGGYRSKQKCGAGSYQSQAGQAMCVLASIGYYVPRSGSARQFLCPKGHYSNRRGATRCVRSSPGWMIIMVNGIALPKKCPKGSYQSKAGQNKCVPASPGYYAPRPASRFQIPCPAGMYQMRRGSFACVKASAGFFVAGRGSRRQYACHLGTYQPKMGQRGCRMAAPGFYVRKMGSKMQMACPKATYQHCSGQTYCISCPKGKLSGHYLPRNAQKQCGIGPKAAISQVGFKPPVVEEDDDGEVEEEEKLEEEEEVINDRDVGSDMDVEQAKGSD